MTPTVRVRHLVYARVEPEFSPQHQAGFQTVYNSPGLSAEEIKTIERRVQCFHPTQSGGVRYQFFRLAGGDFCVTRSKQVDPHPQIIDRDRRQGAFMAHCLILGQSEFQGLDGNPFTLFNCDSALFLDEPEPMVEWIKEERGNEREQRIQLGAGIAPSTQWRDQQLLSLVQLGLQASDITAKGACVLLVGKQAEIIETLQVLFWLLPPSLRMHCSFDSCTDGCVASPGAYWAIGASNRESISAAVMINLSDRSLPATLAGEKSDEQRSPYFQWLQREAAKGRLHDQLDAAPSAQAITQALEHHIRPKIELDPDVCLEFYNQNEGLIRSRLETSAKVLDNKRLADKIIAYIVPEKPARVFKTALSNLPDFKEFSEWAADWLDELGVDDIGRLHSSETKAFKRLYEATYNRRLSDHLKPVWELK